MPSAWKGIHGRPAIYPIDKINGRKSYGSGFGRRWNKNDKRQHTRRGPLRRPSGDGSGLPFSTTIDSLVIVIPIVQSVYSEVYTQKGGIVKTATAKDLRQKTAALLDQVRRGQPVVITYRGKSIAVLTPVKKAERKALHLAGFGMWRDRKDMRSVEKWLSKLRQPRYTR
jgi:prevent-host-death family protein